tara:strand:- start:4 stop:594 length:591 start_codon:yes stop_codon:yes gene_type:complete
MSSYSGRFISNKHLNVDKDCTNNCKKYTKKSIANNNRKNNCLIAVNGKVYDITKYKKDLDVTFNIKCGHYYDNVNENNIFPNNDYKEYKIGEIQYYNLIKILMILLKLIILVIFIFIYNYTQNIYVFIPLVVYLIYNASSFYYNHSERQKAVDNRLTEIDPKLVNKTEYRAVNKIKKEFSKDMSNIFYGVDRVEDL